MAFFSRRKTRSAKLNAGSGPVAVDAVSSPSSSQERGPDAGRSARRPGSDLEAEITRIGSEFITLARSKKAGLLSGQFWSDKLMNWAMTDEQFKIQLFRFIDTFPSLQTPEQVHDHLVDYLLQPGVTLPPGMELGLKAGGLAKGLLAGQMTRRITGMAEKFIAGTDADSALPVLRTLWDRGIGFSVDLLGEACISARVADDYMGKYLDLIERLSQQVASFPANPAIETDHLGPLPRVNVSLKITSLFWSCDPADTAGSIDSLMQRLGPILEAAGRKNVHINFDIEHYEIKDLTLDLFEACCDRFDFPAGLALQAYLRSGPDDARRIIDWARSRGRQITVRLVKGAYWDAETILAEQMGRPVPVWSRKADTDACFEQMASMFIDNTPTEPDQAGVKLALGSHNVRSMAHALACARGRGLPDSAVELQMLRGMGDQLKGAAIEMGLRLREYVPVGEMLVGMAYFVRRLLENTSNESWLRAGFAENASIADLLASPENAGSDDAPDDDPGVRMIEHAPERHLLTPAVKGVGNDRPFFNEPRRDFSDRTVREHWAQGIARQDWPGDSSAPTHAHDLEDATQRARSTLADWNRRTIKQRCAVLVKLADALRRDRDELAGLVIREAGMTWRDADAEVCRAIDFCAYYARVAVGFLSRRQRLGKFIGEHSESSITPRGVVLVIGHFSQPLAGLCAAVAAATVAGNTVLLHPGRGVSRLAGYLCGAIDGAGTPDGCVQIIKLKSEELLLPGPPSAALPAGVDLLVRCGPVPASEPDRDSSAHAVPTNPIIVDSSADVSEAVLGARASGFTFQGQHLLACRHILVVDSAGETFTRRFSEAVGHLTIGDPMKPATDIGPVIDDEQRQAILHLIESAGTESRLTLKADLPNSDCLAADRAYVGPHVFCDVDPAADFLTQPVLGPVVAISAVASFADALDIINSGRRQPIGGIYSRKPSNIELARRELRVGTLFINRPTCDLMVGRYLTAISDPIGVWSPMMLNGSPDDLLPFVQVRAVVENTMRRGFAPEL